MKAQRIIALTKKEMKKTVREPAVLFMIFLFPVVFVFAFGASFGGGGSTHPVYSIGVVNLDRGTTGSQILLGAMSNTTILDLHRYLDNKTAKTELSQGHLQAVIVIPPEFSQSLASYWAAPDTPSAWTNASITLYLDKGSLVATQAIPPIIQQILTRMTHDYEVIASPFQLTTASLVEVKTSSALDFLAPGMFTFASIFLIMMVAQSFAQDRENGMMRRIRTTPTTPAEFMAGQVISYLGIALIQAILVFLMVYLMGFRPAVGIVVYAFAFLVIVIFALSNIGFGLITATISRSSSAATGLSFLFVLPQLFLGTFVGASLSGAAQTAGRFVPSFYVTDALTSLFLRGAGILSASILLDVAVVSVSCVAILIVGIALYAKYYRI